MNKTHALVNPIDLGASIALQYAIAISPTEKETGKQVTGQSIHILINRMKHRFLVLSSGNLTNLSVLQHRSGARSTFQVRL